MCAYSTINFIVDFDCYCALRGFIRTDYEQPIQPAPLAGAVFVSYSGTCFLPWRVV